MMANKLDQYRDDYIRESKEHLEGLNQALLTLEKMPNDEVVLQDLFRHMHTLKSMSALMEFKETESLCHALEDLLDHIRKHQIDSEVCIDVLFSGTDLIEKNISHLEEKKEALKTDALVDRLRGLMKTSVSKPVKKESTASAPVHQIEKMRSVNVKVERLDHLMNLSEEFLMNKMQIEAIQKQIKDQELNVSLKNLSRLINEFQYLVMQARLVPLEYIFNRFPRMVRDLAKAQDKNIDIQLQGGSIELDRAIIDELSECLVHFLRNAIDHGIESNAQREAANKFRIATIAINSYRKYNRIVIEVSDDGAGLPIEKIRKKAERAGLIDAHATEQQVIDTIFSGLSTSDRVSKLSGRGFGLNIIKQKIEFLGGMVSVKTQQGKGCNFSLELPLTLAIIRILFVTCHDTQYGIPINQIVRLLKVPESRIKQVLKNEAIVLDEKEIPVTRLSRLFGKQEQPLKIVPIVIVQHQEKILGIVVDELGSMQDVVIKPMNTVARKNPFFSGSTLVGNSEVVLILDVMNLSLTLSQKVM